MHIALPGNDARGKEALARMIRRSKETVEQRTWGSVNATCQIHTHSFFASVQGGPVLVTLRRQGNVRKCTARYTPGMCGECPLGLRGCAIQQIDGIQGIRLSPEFMEAPTRYRQV